MYFVYVLRSEKNQDLYIGSCGNLRLRFKQHNNGNVQSTKGYRPWKLIYYEAYLSKKDSGFREKRLKQHAAKGEIKKRLRYCLEGQ
jgi:putative endonuclease